MSYYRIRESNKLTNYKEYAKHIVPHVFSEPSIITLKDIEHFSDKLVNYKELNILSENILTLLVDKNISDFIKNNVFRHYYMYVYHCVNFVVPGLPGINIPEIRRCEMALFKPEKRVYPKIFFSDRFWAFVSYHTEGIFPHPENHGRVVYDQKRLLFKCIEKTLDRTTPSNKLKEIKFLVNDIGVNINPYLTDKEDNHKQDWIIRNLVCGYTSTNDIGEILNIFKGRIDTSIIRNGYDIWHWVSEIKSAVYRKEVEDLLGKQGEIDYKKEVEESVKKILEQENIIQKQKDTIKGLEAQITAQKELIGSLNAIIISRT
jgi:hypothetical protein